MPRSKDAISEPQFSFDFQTGTACLAQAEPFEALPIVEVKAVPAYCAAVVVLGERRQRLHLDVIRRLLTETGVFPVK